MSELWPLTKLGDIISLEYGKPLSKEDRDPEGAFPVYGANGEKARSNRFYHSSRTIIVGRKGSAGELNLTEGKFWPLDVTYFVTFDEEKYEMKFLYYLLQTLNLPSMAKGVKPGINRNDVYALEVRIPPKEEQQLIVRILDEAFEKISKSEENSENEYNAANELLESHINNIFDKTSTTWSDTKFGEVCKLRNGRAYKKTELLDEGKYRVLRVGNFFTNKHWYYSDLELDETKFCETGDLLYAWSASFGPRIWEGERSIFHYHIWRVDYDEQILNKKYLYYWFLWDAENIKSEQGTGTTMIHVSMKSMNAREISIPPLEKQQHVVQELDGMAQQVSELMEISRVKSQHYLNLKQSILQEAFSGKLTGGITA